MSKKTKKTLSDRLAELTSAAPSADFDPDQPDFDDGTGAGLSRYDDDDDALDGGSHESALNKHRPSADLRVAADMESIGEEYHGKRVSRKNLGTAIAGDVHDPDQASDGGESASDDVDDDEDGEGGGATSSSKRIVASLNLDDVSSSEEEDEGDDEDDGGDGDGDGGGDGKTVMRESGRGRKRVHWGGEEKDDEEGAGLGGGKRPRQQQVNVFSGVAGEGVNAAASVEEQMIQLDEQDEKARRSGGGVAGQGELRRAREALRQREWWDSLLEVRILLQRLMNAANKLPGPDELPLFLEGDEELTALAGESARAAQGLAMQLSAVRRSHMACWGIDVSNYGDTSSCGESSATAATDGDNEGAKPGEGRTEGVGDKEAVAAREHDSCMGWWSEVLGRWHERTQLVDPSLQKKFRVVNQGPWAQVTASLADRKRANRRAFMTESETEALLGRKLAKHLKAIKSNDDSHAEPASTSASTVADEEGEEVLGRQRRKEVEEPLDLEVIDDRDLYQHLLKEFMDASGAAGNGHAAVPVRRKSRKKTVDRKASKGRKIKYVTHPKMQNFMFPQEYEPPPMEPSELFASLFGGAGNTDSL
eukprot:g9754.t1